jgi:transposase InsO family protein
VAVDQLVIADGFQAGPVCDALEVSRSGFYSWRSGKESERAVVDRKLEPVIREIFWRHRRRYGARRIAAALAQRGIACGVGRVARLLKKQGLSAIQPRSHRPKTTQSDHGLGYNANLLANCQPPTAVNQVWVADITYIPLAAGTRDERFGYLALLMDLFSRRVVGWEFSLSLGDDIVVTALRRAIAARRPGVGLIHHSDRGGQYASRRYRDVLRRASMSQSMSAARNCYDNAFMESCFGTIKTELEMVEYEGPASALRELAEYVRYYNGSRLHSSLGYTTPAAFESVMRSPNTPPQ